MEMGNGDSDSVYKTVNDSDTMSTGVDGRSE